MGRGDSGQSTGMWVVGGCGEMEKMEENGGAMAGKGEK